ncbi:MAG: hypothetical protein P8Y69_12775, partial [Gammaproteobacteria bacterium]
MIRLKRQGLLIISIILVVVLAPGLAKLRLDNSFEIWFPETDPALVTYHSYVKQFGNDEVVVLAVAPATTDGAMSDSARQALETLHFELIAIDGVATVNSLASIPRFDEDDEFLLGETERFADLFIEDGTFKLLVTMEHRPDLEQIRSSVLQSIDAASRRAFPDNQGVWMAGTGVILDALNTETMAQSAIFLPLSYGLILIGLACVTRSLAWTGLAMVVLTAANVSMFGLMGWLGRPITMITMALPPMALVVTVCSILHLQRRTTSMTDATKPIVYAGLTTAGGLFSLVAADMSITRDYGLFAGFIVLVSLLFTLIGASFVRQTPTARQSALLGTAINRAVIRRRPVLVGYACLVGLSLLLITHLHVDTYSLGFLPADHRAQTDSRNIESTFGPYVPLEFILNLDHSPQPEDMAEIHELQTSVQRRVAPRGSSFSYVDAVYASNLVRQYASRHDGLSIDPNRWIDDQGTGIRINWTVPMSSARELAELRDQILAAADPMLPAGASLTSTGYLPLYSRLIEQVIEDQVQSLALALLVILALIAVWLRDLRLLAIAMVINLGPIVMLVGTMAALNIPLDIATITVAPAMLGLIVDDSMHLLYHYQRARTAGRSTIDALRTRVAELGTTLV